MKQLAKKRKAEPAGNGGALASYRDFPFFLSHLRDEFERVFDRFYQGPISEELKGWRWSLDVKDEENEVVVRAEAPGFDAKDFDVQIRGNQLILKAAKKAEKEDKEKKYHEWTEQECYESVTLPAEVDANKITAKYHNGVLVIHLPKTAEGKGKKIAIKAE